MNDYRAHRIADMVLIYRQWHDNNDDDEIVVTGILADLHHWCDTYAVDMARVFDRANRHYTAELMEGSNA